MKSLFISIIIFSLVLVPILFDAAFGSEPCPASGYVHYGPSRQSIPCYLVSQYNPTPEEQSQTINITNTGILFNNPAFCNQHFDQGPTLGETIGEQQCENHTYQINYNGSKLLVTNIINKTTFKVRETISVIPELTNIGNHTVAISYCGQLFVTLILDQHGKIVSPQYSWACPLFDHGVTLAPNVSTPGDSYGQITTLSAPGNYTLTSIVTFGGIPNTTVLWSKPLQITILPEKSVQNETLPCNGYGCGQNSSALKQALLEKQLGLMGPPRSSLSSQDNESNTWLTMVVIGSVVGGVAVAISVYVIRIRK